MHEEPPEQRIHRTTGRFSEAMWRLAKVAFDDPSAKLKVIGVTGTNGKTTTAWLIRDMLNLLGIPCAYIGTLGFGLPRPVPGSQSDASANQPAAVDEELRPLANTTPFTIELNAMLAEAVQRGCKAVAMEVSSHALAERRVDGIEFDVAVFTNLTQDHLDYHGTMQAYEAAKWRLFSDLLSHDPQGVGGKHTGVTINWEDPVGAKWARLLDQSFRRNEVTDFGFEDGRRPCGLTLSVLPKSIGLVNLEFELRSCVENLSVETSAPLGGLYNMCNVLCATAGVMDVIGYPSLIEVAAVLPRVRPVPGRFEPVPNDSGIGIIVDYAHTPDALEKLLATVRPLTKGKVITVFGCGGDRDKTKRPLMARAAQEGSDIVIVTSDNPRTEDPMEIIRDVLDGLVGTEQSGQPIPSIRVEPDRPAAVALAIKLAAPVDTVVIAGKGHENYQIIGRTKFDMDDRDLALAGLKQRHEPPAGYDEA